MTALRYRPSIRLPRLCPWAPFSPSIRSLPAARTWWFPPTPATDILFLHRNGISVAGVGGNHQVLAAGKERIDGEKGAQGHRRGRRIDGRYRSAVIGGAIYRFHAGDRKRQALCHRYLHRCRGIDGDEHVARAVECAADGNGVNTRGGWIRDPMRALLPYGRVRADIYSYLRGSWHIHSRTRRWGEHNRRPRRRETPSSGRRLATGIVETELNACGRIYIAAIHTHGNGEVGRQRQGHGA